MTFDELLMLIDRDRATQVCIDSRQVREGDVFVAVKGAACDGHDFIGAACANEAGYIVHQAGRAVDGLSNGSVPIAVADPAKAAGLLAQAAKGNPASHLTNLAVTGTNGKTTVAYLVRSCLQHAGHRCGLMGTVVYDTGSETISASLTTPDCLTVADLQSRMVAAGATHAVMEASSHALSQDRLAGIDFKAAAFTNLTGDHLDYHKTKEDYLAAKSRLFADLEAGAIAVLNKQSPESEIIAQQTKARVWWYAIDEPTDIRAVIRSMTVEGTRFTLEFAGHEAKVTTPLLGKHNVANHLAAAGLCLAAGLKLEQVAAGLSSLTTIPGRLERINEGAPAVIVDFAHTDDALQNVLQTLRPLCKGNLIVVFGCGGDRDKTKRPRMAKVAEQLADIVIVTSDNPRTEDPNSIIADITAGFERIVASRATSDERRATPLIESDRRKAIELAIRSAKLDDIVLIAGKGHETYQIIGTQKHDFSDKAIARQYLQALRRTPSPTADIRM
jgi:UDP-N-acetylmuramoyl-L-alanyl-D-glutamate--2,6-diaminopimelate ligase